MTLQQLKENQDHKVLKDQEAIHPDPDIIIRNQKIEILDSFTYLGSSVTRDQRFDKEIEIRLTKASTAFNMLRFAIWHRKSVTIAAKLRIFRACVLPVLLYGSETWAITTTHERRINTFYMRCLRTIVGINLGDRLSNEKLLEITGQPPIENILSRNRLRWFGHANRASTTNNEPSLIKKIMFSYFHGEKRPRNIGIRKRWEEKVVHDMEVLGIKNWRRLTLEKDRWREAINRKTQAKPPHHQIKDIAFEYKRRAVERRNEELAVARGVEHRKVIEVLVKSSNNLYKCPGCGKQFKPQGITNHVKACSKSNDWCKKNRIK
jgi:adenylate cyclase class IV